MAFPASGRRQPYGGAGKPHHTAMMQHTINPYVSIDCVLLGIDDRQLNVLVVRQCSTGGAESTGSFKLPGSLIFMDESLDEAARRVLHELTGLSQVPMIQFRAFGGADRIENPDDAVWLQRFHNLEHNIERIVTIAYTALLRINRKVKLKEGFEAHWVPVGELPKLAFDHDEIVRAAVESVRDVARLDPTLTFSLLPRKFTDTQLSIVMETVTGVDYDFKNLHKRIAQMPYVVPLDEKEDGVSHRAARYYTFRKSRMKK